MCFGGDVGVYPHGDNLRELELMVEYRMAPSCCASPQLVRKRQHFRARRPR